ncbi:SWI/SNF complex component SNF12 homolog [Chenopodium quinoa]|uniref:DM2 domain-containing protein n=1 Tax=Chenopodium quinoa TaxID=63459 RepID=A0A803LUX4_CHEQI|nr:SWI/SNF complex component SNF12 homolog [Chenopodium quinoa]
MAQPQSAQAAQVPGKSNARVVNLGTNSSNAGVSSSVGVAATGSANTKKSHNKNSSKPQSSSGTGGGTPFKTMELAPAARRKKRKVPENKLPEKVAALLPESAIYTQLLEMEAKVDAALARKKTDIQETVKRPPCVQKTLRIYVFNTYANQPLENGENKSSETPTWTLKIIGNILENGGDSSSGTMDNRSTPFPKFSSFFKKITICLDQTLYPDNHVIVWENSRSRLLHEGFEVKRKGDKEFTAIIRLEMIYDPEKFKLSAALTQALGLEAETRPRIMAALWHYVKIKKLQDSNDPAFFICDPPLREVFGEEMVKFAVASQILTQHLTPLQPIHLEHKIKLSGNNPSGSMCYDVLVDVPFPLEKDMSAVLEKMEKCKEIDDYDKSIAAAIKKINEHRQRQAFFLGFSHSPAEFVNTLIASQDKDLKVVAGDAVQNAEKEHRSDFFNQPWVEDAVMRYVNRKTASGGDAAGAT